MTLATTGKQEFSRISVLQDFRQPELYQWVDTVVTRFPTISKPQATGLALLRHGPRPFVQPDRCGRSVGAFARPVLQFNAREAARYLP